MRSPRGKFDLCEPGSTLMQPSSRPLSVSIHTQFSIWLRTFAIPQALFSLPHPPLDAAGVSTGMERGCEQISSSRQHLATYGPPRTGRWSCRSGRARHDTHRPESQRPWRLTMLTSWTSPTNARRNGSTRGCAIWRRMEQGVSARAANWETLISYPPAHTHTPLPLSTPNASEHTRSQHTSTTAAHGGDGQKIQKSMPRCVFCEGFAWVGCARVGQTPPAHQQNNSTRVAKWARDCPVERLTSTATNYTPAQQKRKGLRTSGSNTPCESILGNPFSRVWPRTPCISPSTFFVPSRGAVGLHVNYCVILSPLSRMKCILNLK